MKPVRLTAVVVFFACGVAGAGDPPNAPSPPRFPPGVTPSAEPAPNPLDVPSPPTTVPREAVDAVKGTVPKGWTVTARGDTLTIRPGKTVGLYNPIGMSAARAGKPPTASASYDFTLRFRPRVSAEEYDRQGKEYDAIGKKLTALQEGLLAARIRHKFDDWLPNTPEQKKLVDEYHALKQSRPRLPDLYTDTHSIDAEISWGFPFQFVNEDERIECLLVERDVRKLFKSYQVEKSGK